jgi:hypothetical protein
MVRSGFGDLHSIVPLDTNDLVLIQRDPSQLPHLCQVTSANEQTASLQSLSNGNFFSLMTWEMQWGTTPILGIYKSAANMDVVLDGTEPKRE